MAKLFSDFKGVSKSTWLEKIKTDLKGKSLEDLDWVNEEQLEIKPIYHSDDVESSNISTSKDDCNWFVTESIVVENVQQANKAALDALNSGAEAIEFDFDGQKVEHTSDLVKDILLEYAPVAITNYAKTDELIEGVQYKQDIITQFLKTGQAIRNSDWESWKKHVLQTKNISVNVAVYQNAGLKMVEQIAFAAAILVEYLSRLEESEIEQLNTLTLKMAVASNYFLEIAKLKAAQNALAIVLKTYQAEHLKVQLSVESSNINKSKLDENNNLLRNTAACMAAVLGGADFITIHAHDVLTKDSLQGRRWARNISHLLKQESYFDFVANATSGAYYIENVVHQLGEKAWSVFKNIEQEGGFLSAWGEGNLPETIRNQQEEQVAAIQSGRIVLLGVNKYGETIEPKAFVPNANPLAGFRWAATFE